MEGLEVHPGLDSSLQGPQVLHRRAFGVPVGGAWDQETYRRLLDLLALPAGTRVWEIRRHGFSVTVGGARSAAALGSPRAWTIDGQAVPPCSVASCRPGSLIEVAPGAGTVHLAWTETEIPLMWVPPVVKGALAVLPGPDAGIVDFEEFRAREWAVAYTFDRRGIRLDGNPLPSPKADRPSRPQVPGAIQVPPNGQPIIIGPDGPTLGGYPIVAVIAERDFGRLAHAAPGDVLRWTLAKE